MKSIPKSLGIAAFILLTGAALVFAYGGPGWGGYGGHMARNAGYYGMGPGMMGYGGGYGCGYGYGGPANYGYGPGHMRGFNGYGPGHHMRGAYGYGPGYMRGFNGYGAGYWKGPSEGAPQPQQPGQAQNQSN